ncbi:MAG: type VI secretion system baseplate subunit TssK [Desulfatitalea sp.]|nr:type VI secretion system baseplate subunit TssK [Desulfatitalea sp.]NNK00409.1 type VI secretion system baseplate subunit TssK [Desulfatitalea sp.]
MEKPLFWHQGLFLQPQHLQLSSRYQESLNLPLKQFLQPHFWGVGEYAVQLAALSNRSFHLTAGRFLFPDMTFVALPDNAVILPRSFDADWETGGQDFGVFLGLRKFTTNGRNVTVVADTTDVAEVNTRWVTAGAAEPVKDLHQDGPEAQIQRLTHVLKIFWESERDQLGDYELIPLARLERDQDNVRLVDRYVPPSLTIGADETLFGIVKEIRDQIGARSRQLEAYKRDRGLHSAEFGARDMVYLLALRSLNRYATLLGHYTAGQHGHPWTVYGLLGQLIGELTTFSGDISYSGEDGQGQKLLLAYDHCQLGPCFESALSLITLLLDQITAGPEYILPMMFDGTYFVADLPPAMFEGRNRFFMLVETENDPDQVLQALDGIAKLGCRESLPILIARSLSGVGMSHLAAPPQELPRRANALYFQVDYHSDQWGHVQKNKNLALYWDTAPEDLKVELMAVGRS